MAPGLYPITLLKCQWNVAAVALRANPRRCGQDVQLGSHQP